MRGRWTVNLLLLILVAGLVTLARRDLERELEGQTLTGLAPADISDVALDRPGVSSMRLSRSGEGWRMEAPYVTAADGGRIDQLVGIASTPIHRVLPRAEGLQRLGLDPPGARLILNGLELRFGDLDPIGKRRYVAIGEQVYLIDDGFQHHLTARPEDYVARNLLPHGFSPEAGSLDGLPLPPKNLNELKGLTAERIDPLGEEISGRLLSVEPSHGEDALRFILSADGRSWTRLDLRLTYLLAQPPLWSVSEEIPAPDTTRPGQSPRPE